ncbi:MAG: hypothetical protein M0T73_11755 [Deltaproteobacteria bacterium]|nr:hypothetical protein [Deltaproteobacteria bacterium]
MRANIDDFLLSCENVDFGKNTLSKMEIAFYQQLNNEVILLCRSLPESAQADAILFLMHYSGVKFGDELDFFANYYPPIWSIVYWLTSDSFHSGKQLQDKDVKNAVTAQSMAMFLHSLDDHLTDNQIFVSPLTLQLRTEAWNSMNRALLNLSNGIPAGEITISRFINDYYSSNQDSTGLESLDRYCDLFRRQMAILMIAPSLLSMKMTGISDFTSDIETAFGCFGVAWRLLDDVRDIGEDVGTGVETSVCLCLPERIRAYWKGSLFKTRATAEAAQKTALMHIFQHNIIDDIKKRIYAELELAASIVEAHNMAGLGGEFRSLAYPFRASGSHLEEYHET